MSATEVKSLPRSNYARKLADFPDLIFAEQSAFQFAGKWNDFFRQRIGPAYDGRVICEIGCFDAAYLNRIAAKYPNTGFVGIDWKCKAIYDGAQRVAASGTTNVALLRVRGQDVCRVFTQQEVDEVWVFHPDPCDRDSELPSRLVSEQFLRDVYAILRDSTSLLAIKTDHPGYYQATLDLLKLPEILRTFACAMQSADLWNDGAALAHIADRYFSGETTLFESRFIRKRCPIYYLELRSGSLFRSRARGRNSLARIV